MEIHLFHKEYIYKWWSLDSYLSLPECSINGQNRHSGTSRFPTSKRWASIRSWPWHRWNNLGWGQLDGAFSLVILIINSSQWCEVQPFPSAASEIAAASDHFCSYSSTQGTHAGPFLRVEFSVSLSSSTVASKSCYRNELPDAWVKRCMSTMSRGSNLWQMGGSEATRLSDMPGCCISKACKEKGFITWWIGLHILHFAPPNPGEILGVVASERNIPLSKLPMPFHESMKPFISMLTVGILIISITIWLLTIQAFWNHLESHTNIILVVKNARLRCICKSLQILSSSFVPKIEGHWQVKLIPKLVASNFAQNRAVLPRLKRHGMILAGICFCKHSIR